MGEKLGGGGRPEHKPPHKLGNIAGLREQACLSGGIEDQAQQGPTLGDDVVPEGLSYYLGDALPRSPPLITGQSEASHEKPKDQDRIREMFEASLSRVVEDTSDARYSEKWYLRRKLSPYLCEYPFLAEDIQTLTQLRADLFLKPGNSEEKRLGYAAGVFDAGPSWTELKREQDGRIRSILEEAKLKRLLPNSADTPEASPSS